MRACTTVFLLALLPAGLAACGGESSRAASAPRVAFITNGVDPFWDLAGKGAADAATELGIELDYYAPPNAEIGEQKRKIEDLLATGIDGIAISPIDAVNMAELVDEACERTHVITTTRTPRRRTAAASSAATTTPPAAPAGSWSRRRCPTAGP